jgi:streptogramin lyase
VRAGRIVTALAIAVAVMTPHVARATGPTGDVGAVVEYPSEAAMADPNKIATGADGNLWFTETLGDRIGRMSPDGGVTEFENNIPSGSGPANIAAGPDGNLWFVESGDAVKAIARATPEGQVTTMALLAATPYGITTGPDGNVWFTEPTIGIGRITPSGTVDVHDGSHVYARCDRHRPRRRTLVH